LTFPTLLDPPKTTFMTYQVSSIPRHFFIRPDKMITYIGVGQMDYDSLKSETENILP
jgi:hypothetical protein